MTQEKQALIPKSIQEVFAKDPMMGKIADFLNNRIPKERIEPESPLYNNDSLVYFYAYLKMQQLDQIPVGHDLDAVKAIAEEMVRRKLMSEEAKKEITDGVEKVLTLRAQKK